MVFFSTNIKNCDATVIFAILVDRLPVIKNWKVYQYKLNHYLKVIDIVGKKKNYQQCIEAYKNSIRNDPDRWIEPFTDNLGHFLYPSFENSIKRVGYFICPKDNIRIYLTTRESESIFFDDFHGDGVDHLKP